MVTNILDGSSLTPTGWQTFRRHGFFLKPALVATLITGIYLHLAAVIIGHDLVSNMVTPAVDMLFAIPIIYGAIVSWIMWRRVIHRSMWHRLVYGFLAIYFTISIPFHVRTYITGNTEALGSFPAWYSVALLPVLLALTVFAWRLEFRD